MNILLARRYLRERDGASLVVDSPLWAALPADIRAALEASHQPSHEAGGLPSPTFADAADRAQAWIRRETTKQPA